MPFELCIQMARETVFESSFRPCGMSARMMPGAIELLDLSSVVWIAAFH
jgi:hypothetical protein